MGRSGACSTRWGRHAFRPAHLHFIVSQPKYETVVTHIFVDGDPYLDSDAVFGVKESLIVPFVENTDPAVAKDAWHGRRHSGPPISILPWRLVRPKTKSRSRKRGK